MLSQLFKLTDYYDGESDNIDADYPTFSVVWWVINAS